jgi:hypothetical protein
MGIFDRAKCLTGFHEWTSWTYAHSGKCEQTRRCKRQGCDKRETRVEHEWPAFKYVAKDSCEQTRNCSRCKKLEKQIAEHKWSGWTLVKSGQCYFKHACSRCGEAEQKLEHLWGAWGYQSPNSCAQVRFCRRCDSGKQVHEPSFEDHRWSSPKRISCDASFQTCFRCGKLHTNALFLDDKMHVYGPWQRMAGSSREQRTCRDCGHVDRNF